MSPMFQKKPVVIEARRYDGTPECATEIIEWGLKDGATISYHCTDGERCRRDRHELAISTLEGRMFANVGDWVIRGVQGEFYPCKPDIFEATYEATDE